MNHKQARVPDSHTHGASLLETEAERVAFLFELYQKYTSLFPPAKPKQRK